MRKILKVQSGKRKVGKTFRWTLKHKPRKVREKPQMKLSEFFRASPLVGIYLSRDKDL